MHNSVTTYIHQLLANKVSPTGNTNSLQQTEWRELLTVPWTGVPWLQMSTINSKAMSPIWKALIGECDSHFLIWNDYSLYTVYCCKYVSCSLAYNSLTGTHAQTNTLKDMYPLLYAFVVPYPVSLWALPFVLSTTKVDIQYICILHELTIKYAHSTMYSITYQQLHYIRTYVHPYYIHKLWVVCTH